MKIQFQNLSQANSEILKAFNSQVAGKALEAYQPLDARRRSSEKLKALQILKQKSDSTSIADIYIDTDALSKSLTQADGATLQAMLNLLSSKMIEQNKNTVFEFIDKEEEKAKEEEKQEQESSQEQAKEEESDNKNLVDDFVLAIEEYFRNAKERILKLYEGVLDAFSMDRIRGLFDDALVSLKKYMYEVPVDFLDKQIITPIYDLPNNLKNYVEQNIERFTRKKEKKTFTAQEIREILGTSIDTVRAEFNDILDRSIKNLDDNFDSKIDNAQEAKEVDAKWQPKVIINQSMSKAELTAKLHNSN